MIGYKKWSEVLSKAHVDEDFSEKLRADWDTDAAPEIEDAISLAPDGDDKKLMDERFHAALSDIRPSNTPTAQLFYGMGNFKVLDEVRIVTCPNDCISNDQLREIADMIFGGSNVTFIQLDLLAWGLLNIPLSPADNQRKQFHAIVANVAPGPLVVPFEALVPCKPPSTQATRSA